MIRLENVSVTFPNGTRTLHGVNLALDSAPSPACWR